MMLLIAHNSTEFDMMEKAQEIVYYFEQGGIFMVALLLCSFISVAVMIWKVRALSLRYVIPQNLESELLSDVNSLDSFKKQYEEGGSSLARLCCLIELGARYELIEAAARREVTRLRAGLNLLEIIITISPLLGLLGTVTGLVQVFGNFGGEEENTTIAKGIAMALSTTIAGLAVAVPSVIAYSIFNRRIETLASRLELVLSKLCVHL